MNCGQCGADDAAAQSGLCPPCARQYKQKINGLLYLPALGVITSALYSGLNLFYISRLILTHQQLAGQASGYALLLWFSLTGNLAFTLYAGYSFSAAH